MHVLVAAHDFYPDPGSGGTGRYAYETGRRLVDRGHTVSVLTRRRGDVPARETIAGVDVYRYDIAVAERGAPAIAAQLPDALRTVASHVTTLRDPAPPALVNVQGHVTALLLDRFVDADVPRITTYHSPWPTEYRIRTRDSGLSAPRRRLNTQLRRALEGHLLDRSDHLITLSAFMAEECRSLHGDVGEHSVIPGGVDAERFSPTATPLPAMAAGAPAFLTVRRLAPRMGHDLLLEAFAEVASTLPDARLYVAGDGPLRSDLEAQAASLGIADRTTFLGYVPDEDLPGAYAAADCFVLPTRELEGFGLATLEALASATPVVATPVGGTVEVLDGLTDDPAVPEPMLVEAASVDALADGLLGWGSLSSDRRVEAGRFCQAYVRAQYTWEQTAAALEQLFERHASHGGSAAVADER